MIRKVLVANRGEIACRIMRTCAEMGIATVGVFSTVDAHAAHVRAADEAVRLSGVDVMAAYLDVGVLIAAARQAGQRAGGFAKISRGLSVLFHEHAPFRASHFL